MGNEQERPFANDLNPILDELIQQPGQGHRDAESLEEWINHDAQILPTYLKEMSFGATWEEMSLDAKAKTFAYASSNDIVSPFVLAGMTKVGHPLLEGFDDLHKRLIMRDGIAWEMAREYSDIGWREGHQAFDQVDNANNNSFELERIAKYRDILGRLGARVTPAPDISRK